MILKSLKVQNLRVHDKCNVVLDKRVTLIVGPNGSGKTSLLEAIYIGLRGKSFKTADDMICGIGDEWYRIDINSDESSRVVRYRREENKKTFEIDDKTYGRLTEQYKYPVVLFEPDNLRIVSGSPSRRRDYIDMLASLVSTAYGTSLRRYERALIQRNKLLKSNYIDKDHLFAWNVALSRYGAEIIAIRQELVNEINSLLQDVYRTIAPTSDEISVRYSYHQPASSQYLLSDLERAYTRDISLGTTTVGAHRHDLIFDLNGSPANEVGSRGELRTITLALKFIEADIVSKRTGKKPIILLDDVFSELDSTRQERLLSEFHDNQVIMTSTQSTKRKISHIVRLEK